MPGQQLKYIILILLVISCGGRTEKSPQFLPGHILERGDGSELSIDRRLTRTWKDYDGDGIPDRKDPDIDDDGVPNIADQYPFDGTRWGEDLNQNGIADFIDMNSPIQQDLKDRFGIIVINGSEAFSDEQLLSLHTVLTNESILSKLSYSKLSTIVRYSREEQIGFTRADYDEGWETISFYPDEEIDHDMSSFNGTFIHELGHLHAAENPLIYQTFKTSYNDSIPEESYAENFLYQVYKEGKLHIKFREIWINGNIEGHFRL